ncbi:hypothetical protein AL08_03495 [Corynebacterium diphtheriae bv. gravis str. ISS 4746]|nr:hypothetical protein B179_03451 [Corynebacterium diphtheriae str. Aberdeen]KLN42208.1 hypothetical protein AL08_03495 [Corynebacterium diphtheriae bv. gravis str. ISS 4746]KLN44810.1 hypothetical protein AL09_03580 [Corynebacterium diphtheriae bv. gravis str. ISS 4749]
MGPATTPAPAAGVAERDRQLEMRMFLDVDHKNLMAAERSRWQQSPKISERDNRKREQKVVQGVS